MHCQAYGLWPAGKAAGITVAGLLAGVLLGAALQSWLRVDIVPIAVNPPAHLPEGTSGASVEAFLPISAESLSACGGLSTCVAGVSGITDKQHTG